MRFLGSSFRDPSGRVFMKHGKVFRAEANLELPGGILRAENQHEDLRVAIDKVKALLKTEIEKYRARHIPQRSQRRSKT